MHQRRKTLYRRTVFRGLTVLLLAAWIQLPSSGYAESTQTDVTSPINITIGTGDENGIYHPTGVNICSYINKAQFRHGIHCTAIKTAGSIDNAQKVRSGALDFAIVQSDVQYYATKGYGPFRNKGPDSRLRSVVSLHPEAFTIVKSVSTAFLDDYLKDDATARAYLHDSSVAEATNGRAVLLLR